MSPDKDRLSADEIVQMSKEYTFFSWSVQSEVNPIPIDHAEGVYCWDAPGQRYIDFSINEVFDGVFPLVVDASISSMFLKRKLLLALRAIPVEKITSWSASSASLRLSSPSM